MISIEKILSARAFVIPKNQRGYSWTSKEIDDLFSDMELMGDRCHYLGTVICSKIDHFMEQETQSPNYRYFLEDGQQRLTTFIITLKLLRDKFLEVDGTETIDSKQLERLYSYKLEGVKLRLSNENIKINEYLSYLLLNNPSDPPANKTPPIRCLDKAYNHIKNRIDSELTTSESLKRFRNKICNQVQLIDVDLSDHMIDRYLTFDAINSRGLPLTEFDKIKNFCILVCERRGIDIKVDDVWYKAISNLESFGVGSRGNENAFISELFSSFHGYTSSNSDVHEKFVGEYRILLEGSNDSKTNNLKAFIQLWDSYSKSYGFINCRRKDRFYEGLCNKRALDWLIKIERLGLVGITRSLLAASHYSLGNWDDFADIARACEIYTFRMHAISRYRTDKNSKELLKLSHRILKTNITKGEVLQDLGKMLFDNSPLVSGVEKVLSGELNYRNWSQTYYFLYEYELFNSSVSVVEWKDSDEDKSSSIEHILPQCISTSDWWKTHWPDNLLADKWCHRLGNLVITNGNSYLGRKSITLKLNDTESEYCYNSNAATNSEKIIKKYTDGSVWKEQQILLRELDYIGFIVKRWALPCIEDSGNINFPVEFSTVPNLSNYAVVDIVDGVELYPKEKHLINEEEFD
ncbi:TPA: DUF262 domain-containing protein [Vibrio vulnificus]|uniref:DUF262 domain-containing protein n=1 Tax=Vibrio vulnificus TaxID=672 RepID=UPI001A2FC633|nr:DUF262 domain-containing protein [Vibrio vulnificus]ELK8309632.1 DUF262 domain-containing protein [Vibrio vulnificus]MCA3910018.1 DUF262 domain-containing protein [Vibrio vulnificus]HAS8112633.1 DUF262 domain-containing protein [Vibrio vulnificus]HAS8207139.1 DUF262 domain-containing protein [Vibrio vulnificus]HAS8434100.1 DUF262 domain-containing protein [Vibrio vulnificus]